MRSLLKRVAVVIVCLAFLWLRPTPAASDTYVRGAVTDYQGKPIRGALVKATLGTKTVSRFTQADGRYEIAVAPGTYDVTAEAYGFGSAKQSADTAQGREIDLRLSPSFAISRLTGAEIENFLPEQEVGARFLRETCTGCHSFDTIMHRRGSTSAEWQAFLPKMTRERTGQPNFSPTQLATLGPVLEKYFGPSAPFFGPDADPPKQKQVNHVAIPDAALNATFREYKIPTDEVVLHSMAVDVTRDEAWFSEINYQANKIGRFNIASEKFEEYVVPTPNAQPHTPLVDNRNGIVWDTLSSGGATKLVSVDMETGTVREYKWPENKASTHTAAIGADGNLYFSSGNSSDEYMSFNPKTGQFKAYPHPLPEAWPEGSIGADLHTPGPPRGGTYDVAADSKGGLWFTETSIGALGYLDPKTGKTRDYQVGTLKMNGLTTDAQDNVWFSNFIQHKLGRLDPKTGAVKMYQPPTSNSTPYGIVYEKKSGYIWFADAGGNNITRFDPKTEQFLEYPLPTRNSYPRFISLDSKGGVWYSEFLSGKIGVVDPGTSVIQKQISSSR